MCLAYTWVKAGRQVGRGNEKGVDAKDMLGGPQFVIGTLLNMCLACTWFKAGRQEAGVSAAYRTKERRSTTAAASGGHIQVRQPKPLSFAKQSAAQPLVHAPGG